MQSQSNLLIQMNTITTTIPSVISLTGNDNQAIIPLAKSS